MNAGARAARGEFLLFLHADSGLEDPRLLANALDRLREEISRLGGDGVAGHFPLRFQRSDGRNSLAYRFLEAKSRLNRTNTTSGDQGFLLSKGYFERLGGFDETFPFLEDQEMAERIREEGAWITLPGVLATSARRFEVEGFHRRYILMGIIMGLYSTGTLIFFERARNVYSVQSGMGRLLLTPYFRVLRRMFREDLGFTGSIRVWFRLGRYIRRNAWQLFFFIDLLLGPVFGGDRNPCLCFHDRFFRPLTDFAFFDAVTALLSFAWYMGILAAWFRLTED